MTAFAALLRAVNVGGTGKLPMRDLVTMCERAGLSSPRTYIASGNVVFSSDAKEADVKAKLEEALQPMRTSPSPFWCEPWTSYPRSWRTTPSPVHRQTRSWSSSSMMHPMRGT